MISSDDFRGAVADVTSIITKYFETVGYRRVAPHVKPGFLESLVQKEPPELGCDYHDLLRDVERVIIPHLTHWGHPHFYAYFPCGHGYPSVLAEMLMTGLGAIGYSWASNPALTELEFFVCDMYGRLMNLPRSLLYEDSKHEGGGFFQNSASEGVFNCMLAARNNKLRQIAGTDEFAMTNLNRLVAYCSAQAHSCAEKAAMLCMVQIRLIDINEDDAMTQVALETAIKKDVQLGLLPFFVVASLGTTGTAAIDEILEIAGLREKYNFWYHIDAAYGGPALMLPEFPIKITDLNIDSLVTNPYKWLLTALDGSCLWVRSRKLFQSGLSFNRGYYANAPSSNMDLCNHDISFTHRMRSLRLWFTLRWYGRNRLLQHLRNHIELAHYMASKIEQSDMFVLMNKVQFGLVCFRFKDSPDYNSSQLTKELMLRLNVSGKMFLISHDIHNKIIIRLSINYEHATRQLMDTAWNYITLTARPLLEKPVYHNAPELFSHIAKRGKRSTNDKENGNNAGADFDSLCLEDYLEDGWQPELPFEELKITNINTLGDFFIDDMDPDDDLHNFYYHIDNED